MEDIYYEGSNFWRNHASFKQALFEIPFMKGRKNKNE